MSTDLSLNNLNLQDRPRERLLKQGAAALTDAELLALVLRSGGKSSSVLVLAHKILNEFGGLLGLFTTDIAKLIKLENIGIAKATSILALAEICMRVKFVTNTKNPVITGPKDIFTLLRKEFYGKTKEHLYLVSLDSRNKVISADLVSIGTLNESLIHAREVFRIALTKNAASVILVHNHPSGDPTPGNSDIEVTERMNSAGQILGIAVLDHVVVCNDSFASIKAMNVFDKYGSSRVKELGLFDQY